MSDGSTLASTTDGGRVVARPAEAAGPAPAEIDVHAPTALARSPE